MANNGYEDQSNTGRTQRNCDKIVEFVEIQEKSDINQQEVSTLLETLTLKRNVIVEINEKILELTTEDEVIDEMEEADEYMFMLNTKLKEIQKFISSHDQPANLIQSTSVSLNPLAENFTPPMYNSSA